MVCQRFDQSVLRERTAPQLLCERARRTPAALAFRSKRAGIYVDRSWGDYADRVARVAHALNQIGVQTGERVAIMAGAREEWLVCDMAAQSLGAIVYGIYPTCSLPELEYQLKDGGASIFVAEHRSALDKALSVSGRLPDLRRIIIIDEEGIAPVNSEQVSSYAQLLASAPPTSLKWLENRVSHVSPESPAFIVYTSGTTGNPKGALILHGNHLAAASSLIDHYPALAEKEHTTIAYLPMCHVLGRVISTTLPLISRVIPHFGQSANQLTATLTEIQPTVFFAVPRFLQKFATQTLLSVQHGTPTQQLLYRHAMNLARRQAGRRREGRRIPVFESLLYRLCRKAVFKPLLQKIGFNQIELLIFGGAPVSADLVALWQLYGVNIVEIYGQTESGGGIISGQTPPFPVPGNVGHAPRGWEIKLSEEGEVLVKSPYLFERYWNNDAATAKVKPADGWMRTGDIGEMRHGALRLVDRARDFIVTSGGKTLSPSAIENVLRSSPYVSEAIVFGHGRKYLTALIEIDSDMVADWARSNGTPCSDLPSLIDNSAVLALIGREVEKANVNLSRVEQIKSFRLLPKALDPQQPGEPITPTRKIKRELFYERFRPLVDGMYDDTEERLITAEAHIALVA